jgi:hypothetical protein
MTHTYTFTNGEEIEFELDDPEIEAYLSRVREAAHDPDVSSDELLDLIYAPDNPIMEDDIIPGRGVITEELYEHPAYQIMIDQLQIKRTQEGVFDDQGTDGYGPSSGRYSMSVSDAAERLDMSTSAVRQAIYNDRIDAQKRGGSWKLDPDSVDAYEPSDRGPDASGEIGDPLEVTIGSKEGLSFMFANDGELELDEKHDHVLVGTIHDWTRGAVKMNRKREGSAGAITYLELEPSDESSSIEMDEFRIEGDFRIRKVVADNSEAREAFQSFNEQLPDD